MIGNIRPHKLLTQVTTQSMKQQATHVRFTDTISTSRNWLMKCVRVCSDKAVGLVSEGSGLNPQLPPGDTRGIFDFF